MADENEQRKAHNKRHAGRKAERKAEKSKHVQEYTDKQRNPKAFTFKSAVKAQKQFLRTQNLQHKKHHIPVVDRTPLEPPPVLIAIVGGPKTGKSTLLRSLIKIYTKQRLTSIAGPVTVVSGKKRRVTFVEVNNDINCMIDIAKVADMVLMLIDVTFGIEMEALEFLEICRAHGTPKIMGVLNHIDMMKDNKSLKKKKKAMKHRFQVELYPGAKVFYLTGMIRDEYMIHEIKNLSRFIAVSKFRPLTFRSTHPYVYVDRWEDLTSGEAVRQNNKCDRQLVLYGYVRGAALTSGQQVHIPGCGDHIVEDVEFLPDPCPLPDHNKKRSLHAEEKLLYAPFSGVGGVVYDKDAVYIDLGGSQHGRFIMEQQRQQQMLQQRQQQEKVRGGSGVNKFTLESDNGSDDDDDGGDAHQSSYNADLHSEDEDSVDEEAPANLMTRLQGLQEEPDASERRLQIFAGGEHVSATMQQLHQPHYNNPGLRGLPDYESVVDATGRVRRRAIFRDEEQEVGLSKLKEESESDSKMEENESEEEDEEEDKINSDIANEKKINIESCDDEEEEDCEESSEEEQDSDGDSEEEESDVFNLVPRNKTNNSNVYSTEPVYKKQKLHSSSIALSINGRSQDAFSKIQSVLMSLEQKATDQRITEKSSEEDNGYDSGPDGTLELEQRLGFGHNNSDASGSRKSQDSSRLQEEDSKDLNDEEMDNDDNAAFQRAMFEEARNAYYRNQSSAQYLTEYIYGDGANSAFEVESQSYPATNLSQTKGLFDDNEDDFLKPTVVKRTIFDERDTSVWTPPDLRAWADSEIKSIIRDCFVTGTWSGSEDAETLLKLDGETTKDEDLYGDFEDLETGEKFEGTSSTKEGEEEEQEDDATPNPVPVKNSRNARKEKILAKKRKLKEMLDSEFDEKAEYFDSLKADMQQQAQLNRSEFESLSDEVRVLYEGHRAGMYVRMRFTRMPCEFVINFDPTYPVIVGGLLENETKNVYNRVRMKVHRWYPKILKNRDPLILSVGWRRIQTMMYYGKREDDLKLRSLKYARKYLHVEGIFWGPYSPVGTGFVAFQSVGKKVASFRIAANGVMLEADKTTTLVKKLKLIGHPKQVMQKTAYITDMFCSETEVDKFVGAKLLTQSGIRGLLKNHSGLKGDFRAKFEDSIKMSDVIILKTWANVEVQKFCTFVRSLLLTSQEKRHWQGMKTVAQIKRQKNIKNLPNPDSLYTEITKRRTYVPKPLKVPRSLQAALPYRYKPKHESQLPAAERVVVVKDPHEEKMDKFISRYRELEAEKKKKDKELTRAKKQKYMKKMSEQEYYRANREKQRKAAACKKFSLKNRNKPK